MMSIVMESSHSVSRFACMSLEDYVPQSLPEEPAVSEGYGCAEADYGWSDDRGVGVVEIILILVVLIALVTLFKDQLTDLVQTILDTITENADAVMG